MAVSRVCGGGGLLFGHALIKGLGLNRRFKIEGYG